MVKLLVHICCAPCCTYAFEYLEKKAFDIEGFFYNPNIYPETEYYRRLNELLNFANSQKYKIIVKEDTENKWLKSIKGFESEKEGGQRCEICYRVRLEETAKFAKSNNFDGFTTVLTISPHKNARLINQIGKELEKIHDIYFLETDFKKNDGFKKSLELSRKYNLYRQNYCGCKYSNNKK